ncbi:DUF6503 family protein [Dokdonia sp. Hel_I_53]|uniref:DUF6503 family protein n=1 Tax=Dokdonia sp. Hel_I_53 TaxID=1566287 RepID=UPI00119AE2A4|nr:DUF6503 family protein [Dokdonia sp. Hel_I_53]TVZ52122.1 hypothetical protein OD90_1286 [Dokdonia sp. Hel_I_53]
MKKMLILELICCLAFAKAVTAQQPNSVSQITGQELLNKVIAFHDPANKWPSFKGTFTILLESPKMQPRKSTVTLNLPEEYFKLVENRNGKISTKEVSEECCILSDKDMPPTKTALDDDVCKRALMLKNYYTYLYGLPMKLRDPGTIINPIVLIKNFKGKEYLTLRVTYNEEVGSDNWEFYFNPKTYAMEAYRFFKGDDRSTGEYILLTGLKVINGIKMPENRAWYYNKDNGYLGTDKLIH